MKNLFSSKRNVALIALLYTFLWGCAFPLVKLCMTELGAVSNTSKCLVAGIRFSLSGAVLLFFGFCRDGRRNLLCKNELLPILLYGVLATSCQYAFTYIALSRVDGAKGAIFDQLCVFIIIILGGLFLKNDRLTPRKLFGSVIGFLGVLAVSTEQMSFTFTLGGEGLMTLSALCQAAAYFVAVMLAGRLSEIKLVGYGQLVGGTLLTVFALIGGGRIGAFSLKGALILLALVAISAIAYVTSLIPLKYFPASEVSVFNLLITVFGVVMSALVLGEEVLRINYLISLILISLGIFLVNTKRRGYDRKHL